jgi:hypothetical protein
MTFIAVNLLSMVSSPGTICRWGSAKCATDLYKIYHTPWITTFAIIKLSTTISWCNVSFVWNREDKTRLHFSTIPSFSWKEYWMSHSRRPYKNVLKGWCLLNHISNLITNAKCITLKFWTLHEGATYFQAE